MNRSNKFDKIKIGNTAKIKKKITKQDVELFAKISGDFNPLHFDEEYAKKSIFKGKIVHGLLYASIISAVLGTKLPGPGSIYLSQSLKFLRPVNIGDTITAEVKVVEKDNTNNIIVLETICRNQSYETVIIGEANIKMITVRI